MKKINLSRSVIILISVQLLVLLIAGAGFLTCKMNLHSQTLVSSDFNIDASAMDDDTISLTTDLGYDTSVMYSHPFPLSKGSYNIYVDYHTDTAGNRISALSYATFGDVNLYSAPITLRPDGQTAVLSLWLNRDAKDILLQIDYDGAGTLQIPSIIIQQNTDSAKQGLLIALAICLAINLLYFAYKSDTKTRLVLFALTLITLISSYPLFTNYLINGHDLEFHLNRIEGLVAGLQNGIFPVKIHPNWIEGYGYATGVMYCDTLLYFPAVLRLFGLPIQTAYAVFVFVINAATAVVSYLCFKKIIGETKLSLLATMLYSLSFYRLVNIYTRAAVGEYSAMLFLPMVLAGLYDIFTNTKDKWWKQAILPAVGLAGIIHSHVLTSELTALFIVITCFVFIKRVFKLKTFLALATTAALALLLCLSYVVPFLDYFVSEKLYVNSADWVWKEISVQSCGMFPTQLFAIFQNGTGAFAYTAQGVATEFAPGLGASLVFGFLLIVLYFFVERKSTQDAHRGTITLLFVYGVITLFMSTYLFPWDALSDASEMLHSVISSMQFPFRMLTMAVLFLCPIVCLVLKADWTELGNTLKATPRSIKYTFGGLLCLLTMLSTGWFYHDVTINTDLLRAYDTYELDSSNIATQEYLPEDTMVKYVGGPNLIICAPGTTYADYSKTGTDITCTVTNTQAEGYIEFPLLAYKGYKAVCTETGEEFEIVHGHNARIRVMLPTDFSGQLHVYFEEPIYWRIAEILSLLTLAGICIYLLLDTRRKHMI